MGHNREIWCDEGWCCEYIRDAGGGFWVGGHRVNGWDDSSCQRRHDPLPQRARWFTKEDCEKVQGIGQRRQRAGSSALKRFGMRRL